jgi:hypothetical protein
VIGPLFCGYSLASTKPQNTKEYQKSRHLLSFSNSHILESTIQFKYMQRCWECLFAFNDHARLHEAIVNELHVTLSTKAQKNDNITTTTLQQQHYNNNITTTTLQQQHYNNNITTTTLQQQHYNNNNITTTTTTTARIVF